MSDDFYDDYGSPFIDVPYSCGCYLWYRCPDHTLMLKSLAERRRLRIEREKRSKALYGSWSDIIALHGGTDGPT